MEPKPNLETKSLSILNKLYQLCPQYDNKLNDIMKEQHITDINSIKLNKVDIIPLIQNSHINNMFDFILVSIKSKSELDIIRSNMKALTLYKEKIDKNKTLKLKKEELQNRLKEKNEILNAIKNKNDSLISEKQALLKDYKQVIKAREVIQAKNSIMKVSEIKLKDYMEEFSSNYLEDIINIGNSNKTNFISEQTNEEMYKEFLLKNMELIKKGFSNPNNPELSKKLPILGNDNLNSIPFLIKNNTGYITNCVISHLDSLKTNIEQTYKDKQISKKQENKDTSNQKKKKEIDSNIQFKEIIYSLIEKFELKVIDYQRKLSLQFQNNETLNTSNSNINSNSSSLKTKNKNLLSMLNLNENNKNEGGDNVIHNIELILNNLLIDELNDMINKSEEKNRFSYNSYGLNSGVHEFKFTELVEKNNFSVSIDVDSYIKENIKIVTLVKKAKKKIDSFVSNHVLGLLTEIDDNFNNFRSSFYCEFDYFKSLGKSLFKNEKAYSFSMFGYDQTILTKLSCQNKIQLINKILKSEILIDKLKNEEQRNTRIESIIGSTLAVSYNKNAKEWTLKYAKK